MATKSTGSNHPGKQFRLEGSIELQQFEAEHEDLGVKVFVFDRLGEVLGGGDVDAKGHFEILVGLTEPADIQLMAGPGTDAISVRQSSAYAQNFAAKDWTRHEGGGFVIRPKLIISRPIWWPWRPVRICVSGHVRKIDKHEGHTEICPVPFVKVEIFDVDRESCYWPPIRNWWDTLLDRPVVRLPDLLRDRPSPLTSPAPTPHRDSGSMRCSLARQQDFLLVRQ
jgi:hypothetical protein